MRHENTRHKLFARRALILTAGKGLLLSALFSRLYYLQQVKGQDYRTQSEHNRVKLRLIAPDRGILFDRNAHPLAVNEDNFRLMTERGREAAIKERIAQLAPILQIDPAQLLYAYQRGIRKNSQGAVAIAEHLPWETVARVEVRLAELANIFIDVGKTRYYPYDEVFSHVLGFVGAIAEKDPEAKQFERLPDLKIGKKGIEKALDAELIGKPGVKHVEVNVKGQSVRELTRESSTPGKDIYLALNYELQRFTYERLAKERSASVVVMDAWTGEVLTMTSYPGFDPNKFSQGIGQKDWDALLKDIRKPLINKAIAGIYPPGSTYKMMTGLAALEKGIANAQTRVYCPGFFHLGNHRFNCWKHEGHGSLDMKGALAQSCDTFFYTMAHRMGYEPIGEVSRRFGLGEATGVGIPGEADGLIPTKEWKVRRFGIPWQKGDNINASIGQGYVLTTPMQLALMTARLVNGGYAVKTTLLRATHKAGHEPWEKIPVKDKDLKLVLEGMHMVMNHPRGTAYWKRITQPGLEMGGKTGTAQVKRIERGRDSATLPWHHQHHALFVGYAPVQAPRYVCAVVVEHGGGGSATAAPIAAEVLLKTQQLEGYVHQPQQEDA